MSIPEHNYNRVLKNKVTKSIISALRAGSNKPSLRRLSFFFPPKCLEAISAAQFFPQPPKMEFNVVLHPQRPAPNDWWSPSFLEELTNSIIHESPFRPNENWLEQNELETKLRNPYNEWEDWET